MHCDGSVLWWCRSATRCFLEKNQINSADKSFVAHFMSNENTIAVESCSKEPMIGQF